MLGAHRPHLGEAAPKLQKRSRPEENIQAEGKKTATRIRYGAVRCGAVGKKGGGWADMGPCFFAQLLPFTMFLPCRCASQTMTYQVPDEADRTGGWVRIGLVEVCASAGEDARQKQMQSL